MPSWNIILSEALRCGNYDQIRKKYIDIFSRNRNRNVIVYYSDWLNQKKQYNIDINDSDMTGFMNAVCGLDRAKGLDLILHTPGGNPMATESIVKYLHNIFGNNIEIFVPHMAMSAGTMLACSGRVIWMGKQSSLGPIDPQFNGIPAFSIKKEFEEAQQDLQTNPDSFRNWQIRLAKYPQAFYYLVLDSIDLSSKLAKEWLENYMFSGEANAKKNANDIVKKINANQGSHSKHFDIEECKNIGFKIAELESDNLIQDDVLSIYHACNITGSATPVTKIIESSNGTAYICQNLI